LSAQRTCLNVMECADDSSKLAATVAGAVLAGEVSLMAALCEGHLVKAHMDLNRRKSP
jgi:hydroxymethylglutaryl-CoA reductase (NADPH)